MEMRYILAYDLGTSGAKCVLVTTEGALLATATAGYPLYTDGGDNRAEQEPEDYWQAVCHATKEVLSGIDPAAVAGIAFGTMWKGIIPIDKEGNILHRSILWMDGRASTQMQKLIARFGSLPGMPALWVRLTAPLSAWVFVRTMPRWQSSCLSSAPTPPTPPPWLPTKNITAPTPSSTKP